MKLLPEMTASQVPQFMLSSNQIDTFPSIPPNSPFRSGNVWIQTDHEVMNPTRNPKGKENKKEHIRLIHTAFNDRLAQS